MRHLTRPLLAAILCLLGSLPLSATAEPDTAQLRRALAQAFGDDVEIARTEVRSGLRERSGTFWLVYARPRRSGDYQLTYRYDYRDAVRPDDPLYTHVEHTSTLRVGERGCWRRREGRDACLGDTVILPFVLDYTGHTFRVTRRPLSPGQPASSPEPLFGVDTTGSGAVANPLAAQLKYVGSRSGENLRRNGGGWIVYSATFEAVRPGRFNLAVGARYADGAAPAMSAYGSVPVVIVPRGQPVTVLLAREQVVGRDEVQGFSSHTGNEYLTTAQVLQPGDRITLDFGRQALPGPGHARLTRASAEARVTPPLRAPIPVIARFPFHLDPGERFNAWIVDHLPRP